MVSTPFDFATLEVQIRTAAKAAFNEVASARPDEQMCAFACIATTSDPSVENELAMIARLNDEAVVSEFRSWTKTWAT